MHNLALADALRGLKKEFDGVTIREFRAVSAKKQAKNKEKKN